MTTNDGPIAAPGWYPTPEGGKRYWDGQQWLDLPEPGSQTGPDGTARNQHRSRVGLWVATVVVATALIAISALWLKWQSDNSAALASSSAAAQSSANSEAAQERAEERERKEREETVEQVEAAIKELAEQHALEGLIDGPVLAAQCSPVAGGSVDDLEETTTVLECFVTTEAHADGTETGYYYNATVNWEAGRYTYGLGPA